MKKQLILCACVASGLLSWAGDGDTVERGGLKFTVISEAARTVSLSGYSAAPVELAVPESLNVEGAGDYAVVTIGRNAFAGCRELTSVTVPRSVSLIDVYAFAGCEALTSVTLDCKEIGRQAFATNNITDVKIGENVETIGEHAFGRSNSLTEVVIPSNVKTVASYAFDNCGSLTKATVNAAEIKSNAFSGCVRLDELTLGNPSGEQTIAGAAFFGCSALTQITLDASVVNIDANPFQNCTALSTINVASGNKAFAVYNGMLFTADMKRLIACPATKSGQVMIPGSVTEISPVAFSCCESMTSVNIPGTVSRIGALAFQNCTTLQSVRIPDAVTVIQPSTFVGCTSLASVWIPDNLTEIGSDAFAYCTSLGKVFIPATVESLGSAFNGCSSLQNISVDVANPRFASYGGVLYRIEDKTLLKCPEGKAGTYYIEEGTQTVGYEAFANCSHLTQVSASEGLMEIRQNAFSRCTALRRVYLPSGLNFLGSEAFLECKSLKEIELPEGLSMIQTGTFARCESLEKVVLPMSLQRIAPATFDLCPLRWVYSFADEPCEAYGTFRNVPEEAVLYVLNPLADRYRENPDWAYFKDIRNMMPISISIAETELKLRLGDEKPLEVDVVTSEDDQILSSRWVSSNKNVAFVDNGVVKALAVGEARLTFTVNDKYGLSHSVYCNVVVEDVSGIEDLETGSDEVPEYYRLDGVRIDREDLSPGLYIRRSASKTEKIIIR